MKKIIVIGGGDLGRKVIRLIQKINKYQIIGYTDSKNCGLIFGIKYLGNDSILDKFKGKKNISAALAFGANAQQLSKRKEIIKIIKKNRINTPNIISPKASIEKYASMKEGNIIFDGSIIDFSVSLGNFGIINLNTTVCHDCKISDNLILSPNSVILGGCKIGKNVFIGANATINQYLTLTDECLIGSGSVVTKDCLSKGTYIGNPAKKKLTKNYK